MSFVQYINNGSPICFIHILFITEAEYYTDIHILNWTRVTAFAGNSSNKELETEHFTLKDNASEESWSLDENNYA